MYKRQVLYFVRIACGKKPVRFSVAIVLPADGKSMIQIMRCAIAVARQYHISQIAATGLFAIITGTQLDLC